MSVANYVSNRLLYTARESLVSTPTTIFTLGGVVIMSVEKLREPGNVLREPGESIEGRDGERLREQADQLSELAERDRRPDHGGIARHQQKLKAIEEAEPAVADAIDEALTPAGRIPRDGRGSLP